MAIVVKILFLSAFIVCAESVISIDIDPVELQSIGEVLVESYLHHNLIQRKPSLKNNCYNKIQQSSIAVLQWIGITSSLLGANLLTMYFQAMNILQPVSNINNNIIATVTTTPAKVIKPSEVCPGQYGCDDNMCWKSCGTEINAWCYTSPKPKNHHFQHCSYSYECSPCWTCLGPCNSNKK